MSTRWIVRQKKLQYKPSQQQSQRSSSRAGGCAMLRFSEESSAVILKGFECGIQEMDVFIHDTLDAFLESDSRYKLNVVTDDELGTTVHLLAGNLYGSLYFLWINVKDTVSIINPDLRYLDINIDIILKKIVSLLC